MQASLLNAFSTYYGIAPASLTSLSGGHFALVYACSRQEQECILRVTPPSESVDLRSTCAVLEWLAFPGERGGPVARPIPSLRGKLIEAVEYEGQSYLATAFEKAPGVLAEKLHPEAWSDDLFQELGRAIGCCHRIAHHYGPSQGYRLPDWDMGDNCFCPPNSGVRALTQIEEGG